MHSQPGHFTPDSARLMQITAQQMAIILENAELYSKFRQSDSELQHKELHLLEEEITTEDELSKLGIFIMFGDGNFSTLTIGLLKFLGIPLGNSSRWIQYSTSLPPIIVILLLSKLINVFRDNFNAFYVDFKGNEKMADRLI
jgi:hypothetical protein